MNELFLKSVYNSIIPKAGVWKFWEFHKVNLSRIPLCLEYIIYFVLKPTNSKKILYFYFSQALYKHDS